MKKVDKVTTRYTEALTQGRKKLKDLIEKRLGEKITFSLLDRAVWTAIISDKKLRSQLIDIIVDILKAHTW